MTIPRIVAAGLLAVAAALPLTAGDRAWLAGLGPIEAAGAVPALAAKAELSVDQVGMGTDLGPSAEGKKGKGKKGKKGKKKGKGKGKGKGKHRR